MRNTNPNLDPDAPKKAVYLLHSFYLFALIFTTIGCTQKVQSMDSVKPFALFVGRSFILQNDACVLMSSNEG